MASILVVDDSEAIHEALTAMLGQLGHEVTTAWDGEEALDLASAVHFDLLVTDIEMPRMNGLLLIDRLRAVRPDLDVLAMSGSGNHRTEALRRGARVFLSKPFSLADLVVGLDGSALGASRPGQKVREALGT